MDVEEKLTHLPDHPGVYLMRDAGGRVIYVGKASSLRNRVRSYFRGRQPPRTATMVSQVADLEYILTENEVEALILECNLIKEHRPRYNVLLKDDKSYPYIKITSGEPYPAVMVTRSVVKDGSRYFGPYTNVGSLRKTLKLLRGLFPVRSCKAVPLQPRGRPCLNAHINRCLAPCTGEVDEAVYREAVNKVILFLEGKYAVLAQELKEQMAVAAAGLEFEKAARLRDQLLAVQEVSRRQKVADAVGNNADVIALAREGETVLGLVFFNREGKVVGCSNFFLSGTGDKTREEVTAALLKGYYSRGVEIPEEIFLQDEPEDKEVISRWLTRLKGSRVVLKVPRRGKKHRLLKMVEENALNILREHLLAARNREEADKEAMTELCRVLGLTRAPRRMEAYDISSLQGSSQVGAMAVFVDGRPYPSAYRRFQVKSVPGPNDYAALQEIIRRRFTRAAGRDPGFAELPDFVLVDGGIGQLRAVKKVMAICGVGDIPTFSLAKEDERLYWEDSPEPIFLPRESKALHLLQYLRDEVHRFAVTYHRKKREKSAYTSVLDTVPGVGSKRKRALLRRFGSIEKIRQATLEELASVEGMNRVVASRIMESLGRELDGENKAGCPGP